MPSTGWPGQKIGIGIARIQLIRIVETTVTALALPALVFILRRTNIGLAMRAAARDFDMVRMAGINANKVITAAFAVSAFLAGLAAILLIARRGAVDPFMGFAPVLKAFVAAVPGGFGSPGFGLLGFGSLGGAVAGGFLLGVRLHEFLGLTGFFPGLVIVLSMALRPGGMAGTDEIGEIRRRRKA